MAAKIIDVFRPFVPDPTASSSSGKDVAADHLIVKVDLDNNGRRIAELKLAEADYAGLIAEYVAGSATTILDASVVTALAAHVQTDSLSTAQRSYLGTTKTWPT